MRGCTEVEELGKLGPQFLCPVRGWQRAGCMPATAARPFPAADSPGSFEAGLSQLTDGAYLTQSRWDYVNVRGFGVLTVASALWLPGVYGPWGINQQETVAGLSGHSLLTIFPLLREARRGTTASL